MLLAIMLALLPIIVVFILMTVKKTAVDHSGLIGWVLASLIAIVFFNTAPEMTLRASLAGVVASLGISLMIVASILQITFMEATGALKRICVCIKTLASTDKAVQILFISMGTGTLLVSVGATPVSILPPIMIALGYSPFVAVALPAIGYDSLCTYALLGISLVVFSDMTGTTIVRTAQAFAAFMPVISTAIGFGMLWIVGKGKLMKAGFIPCMLAGATNGGVAIAIAYIPFLNGAVLLTGVIAGFCTMLMLLLYLKLQGKPIIDRSVLSQADLEVEQGMSLTTALLPWIILVTTLLVINFYKPLYNLVFNQWDMAVSVLPGQVIKTRMLWNGSTWVLISTIVAAIFMRTGGSVWKHTLIKWGQRAPRPFISSTVFFAISFVMMNSGPHIFGGVIEDARPVLNMIGVLAQGSIFAFGSFYPFISAFLGLFGGFVTSSETSTIGMLAKYHLLTAKALHIDPLMVNAASAVGAGLASLIAPTKLQNAAATIDAMGIESQVIKTGLIISLLLTAITGIIAMIFYAFFYTTAM
ncbi:MAG: putative L-lactate permease family protein [Sporomusa sp.]|nr:putative L-lactate permease family protein [Sporomusa sp.]